MLKKESKNYFTSLGDFLIFIGIIVALVFLLHIDYFGVFGTWQDFQRSPNLYETRYLIAKHDLIMKLVYAISSFFSGLITGSLFLGIGRIVELLEKKTEVLEDMD